MKAKGDQSSVRIALPVDFQIVGGSGSGVLSPLHPGVTRSLSSREVCFDFNPKGSGAAEGVGEGASLFIVIHFPRASRPARGRARVKALDRRTRANPSGYTVHAVFEGLPQSDRALIDDYLAWVGRRPRLMLLTSIVLLGLGLASVLYVAGLVMVKGSLRRRTEESESTIAALRKRLSDAEEALAESKKKAALATTEEAKERRERELSRDKQSSDLSKEWEAERENLRVEVEALRDRKAALLRENAVFREKIRYLDRTRELLETELRKRSVSPRKKPVLITYKNGRTVSGTIVEEDAERIRLQTEYGPVEAPRKLIKHIETLPFIRGKERISP